MALDFANVVKGQITQTVVGALFERWRYRVARLGIEELFGEIKHIDLDQYRRLNLPIEVRTLPDLLVTSIDMTEAFLVEVKFRRKLDEDTARSLHAVLSEQRKHWPQSYAILIVAESFVKDGRFHQDYIRVIRPDQTDKLIDSTSPIQSRWDSLAALNSVFKPFGEPRGSASHADYLTAMLKQLASLS
jgi:hypothetical protein